MRLAAIAALVSMTGCFLPIEDNWLGSADAGGAMLQPGCTLENCRTMVEACRVEPVGSPAASCAAVAPVPSNFDFAPYCVNACNAQRGSGALIQCIAGKADQCRAAADGGASVPSVYAACSDGSSSVPQKACQDGCTSARTTCDDRCSGGRACDNCRRAGTPDCSSVCPDAGFKECTDCSAACGLSYVACVDACPRVSALKPGVMFLIDKSGSMNFAADDSVAPCTNKCNQSGFPACAAGCPTRLQALKSALNTFLTASPTAAWMGMAVFPTAVAGSNGVVDACGATTSADVRAQLSLRSDDQAADLAAAAQAVNAQVQAVAVGGGTPTGDSLKFLRTYPPLTVPGRNHYVVLITDGLPNCNANNANSCTGTSCRCTLVPATSCTPASFCTQGCLDADATASQVAQLRSQGIKTIVIGFGAETASGDGPDTLNAMAAQGGFSRACPNGTDAECGPGDTCTIATRLCGRRYYQATSATELAAALASIAGALP